jgi:hypothetical protein
VSLLIIGLALECIRKLAHKHLKKKNMTSEASGLKTEYASANLERLGFHAAVVLGCIFHRSSCGSLRNACPGDDRLDRAARSSITARSCNQSVHTGPFYLRPQQAHETLHIAALGARYELQVTVENVWARSLHRGIAQKYAHA